MFAFQEGKKHLFAAFKVRPDNCILHVGSHAYGALLRQRLEAEKVAEAKRKLQEEAKVCVKSDLSLPVTHPYPQNSQGILAGMPSS